MVLGVNLISVVGITSEVSETWDPVICLDVELMLFRTGSNKVKWCLWYSPVEENWIWRREITLDHLASLPLPTPCTVLLCNYPWTHFGPSWPWTCGAECATSLSACLRSIRLLTSEDTSHALGACLYLLCWLQNGSCKSQGPSDEALSFCIGRS